MRNGRVGGGRRVAAPISAHSGPRPRGRQLALPPRPRPRRNDGRASLGRSLRRGSKPSTFVTARLPLRLAFGPKALSSHAAAGFTAPRGAGVRTIPGHVAHLPPLLDTSYIPHAAIARFRQKNGGGRIWKNGGGRNWICAKSRGCRPLKGDHPPHPRGLAATASASAYFRPRRAYRRRAGKHPRGATPTPPNPRLVGSGRRSAPRLPQLDLSRVEPAGDARSVLNKGTNSRAVCHQEPRQGARDGPDVRVPCPCVAQGVRGLYIPGAAARTCVEFDSLSFRHQPD